MASTVLSAALRCVRCGNDDEAQLGADICSQLVESQRLEVDVLFADAIEPLVECFVQRERPCSLLSSLAECLYGLARHDSVSLKLARKLPLLHKLSSLVVNAEGAYDDDTTRRCALIILQLSKHPANRAMLVPFEPQWAGAFFNEASNSAVTILQSAINTLSAV